MLFDNQRKDILNVFDLILMRNCFEYGYEKVLLKSLNVLVSLTQKFLWKWIYILYFLFVIIIENIWSVKLYWCSLLTRAIRSTTITRWLGPYNINYYNPLTKIENVINYNPLTRAIRSTIITHWLRSYNINYYNPLTRAKNVNNYNPLTRAIKTRLKYIISLIQTYKTNIISP